MRMLQSAVILQSFAQVHRTLSSQDWSSQCPGIHRKAKPEIPRAYTVSTCHPNLPTNFSQTFPSTLKSRCFLSRCWSLSLVLIGSTKLLLRWWSLRYRWGRHLNFQADWADWTMKDQLKPSKTPLLIEHFSFEWKILNFCSYFRRFDCYIYFTISPFHRTAISAVRKSRFPAMAVPCGLERATAGAAYPGATRSRSSDAEVPDSDIRKAIESIDFI